MSPTTASKSKKKKVVEGLNRPSHLLDNLTDPAAQQQLKHYEEGMRLFQQQKFHKAKAEFERALVGPSRELADRARVHLRICVQRIERPPVATPRTADDHYHHGVAMMNLGHWDEARDHLERALKLAPKADYVIYALAALDCLTGEADAALEKLKRAIELRPENRYHARNDEDFAFLQEDPRFTELLYPEREVLA
ncbi:MAG: tetratricopeptide repeat protein [Firmicutes bacterium]|nr:tetratricopeptide repeat protein [Bacillota bacterium]